YNEALEGWSKHDIERIHMYHCLNYVLLHLVEDWRGLHPLVLVFLRKSSTLHVSLRARIDDVQSEQGSAECKPISLVPEDPPPFYSCEANSTTRSSSRKRRDWMLDLLSEAVPIDTLALQQLTPLEMLQDGVNHIVREGYLYDPTTDASAYHTKPTSRYQRSVLRRRLLDTGGSPVFAEDTAARSTP
ncbi:hypothetical protein LTS12_028846, partial [Elasticomyces elasticus]